MNSLDLVESLLYKIPEIRFPLMSLDVINLERKISPTEHPEFKNILKPFNKPKIISIIGLTQLVAIIEPIKIGRTYSVILIKGEKCEILNISKTKISQILFQHLIAKDYFPEPFVRKIIYIDNYEQNIKGIVFSEFKKNEWTIGDPLDLPISSSRKIGGKAIIDEILSTILN